MFSGVFLVYVFAVCVLHVRVCVNGGVAACVRGVLNCVCRVITSSTVGSLFILRLTVYRLFSQNDLELIAPTFMCVNMGRSLTHMPVCMLDGHMCVCALSHAHAPRISPVTLSCNRHRTSASTEHFKVPVRALLLLAR